MNSQSIDVSDTDAEPHPRNLCVCTEMCALSGPPVLVVTAAGTLSESYYRTVHPRYRLDRFGSLSAAAVFPWVFAVPLKGAAA